MRSRSLGFFQLIEDMLFVFPDFIVIDTFKTEIEGSLKESDQHIMSTRLVWRHRRTPQKAYVVKRKLWSHFRYASVLAHAVCSLGALF